MAGIKKIPMRKCVGCREMKTKKELVRVVKNSEGEISLDLTGKAQGKGAYICRNLECFRQARKSKGFEHALSCSVPQDVFDRMEEELKNNG